MIAPEEQTASIQSGAWVEQITALAAFADACSKCITSKPGFEAHDRFAITIAAKAVKAGAAVLDQTFPGLKRDA